LPAGLDPVLRLKGTPTRATIGAMGGLRVVPLLVVLASGCGGRVSDGSDPDPTAGVDRESSGEPGPDQSANGSILLPECERGFSPMAEPDRDCNFIVSGRCYDTKVDACGCACPRVNGTTCVSGFPQENGQVLVECF